VFSPPNRSIPKIRSRPNFRLNFQIPYPRISLVSQNLVAPVALTVVAVVGCAGVMGDSYGSAAMDFEFVPASPDSRWMGEATARRRQRRLSSPSLRAFLTPAFEAVAGREGGASGYSSSSSGGLDLGFDASLLRYRRAYFDATSDLDSCILHFSPQSAPPPPPSLPPQARMAYPVADDGVWSHGAYHYCNKHEVILLLNRSSFTDMLVPSVISRTAEVPSLG
jgi:hypothetical protein